MDIPRTYLADVAHAALAKIGKTEPHPLAVEQAIVDLQGVMNVIANGATELITTPFEQAAVESLAEIPLYEWRARWHEAVKEEQAAAKVATAKAEAEAAASMAELAARTEAEAAEIAAKAEAEAAASTSSEGVSTPPVEPSPAKPTTTAKAKNK